MPQRHGTPAFLLAIVQEFGEYQPGLSVRMDRNQSKKAATLHDVAKAAGVSVITASRALSNPIVVSDKTLAQVKLAVESTGYIPNFLAGSLKSKRSLMVAGIVPALSVQQFLPTVQALSNTLEAAGYTLLLGQTAYRAEREEDLLNAMISRQPDGIVMIGLVQSERARERLKRSGIPVVETWDMTHDPVDMVIGFSHLEVGRAVGRFFVSKGWRNVGVLTGEDYRAQQRREGFVQALGRDVPTAVIPAPNNLAMGRRALVELLEKAPALDAVCCSSDMLAHGAIVEARARGIRVPEDLAVCGFGNADFSADMAPSITTVNVDGPEIGNLAASLIVDRRKGAPATRKLFDLGFRIIERESTNRPA